VLAWYRTEQAKPVENTLEETAQVTMHVNITKHSAYLDKSMQKELQPIFA
jgi:hypothetical protein